jgi:hypothetical protein
MQTENCISCGIGLEPIVDYVPSYDDGGGLDALEAVVTFPEDGICEGCYEHIPGELYIPDSIESEDDKLPF